MEPYEEFRRILDTHPAGAPHSSAIDEILRLLFTEDEIRIAIHMSFRLKTAEEIARNASVTQEEAMQRLDSMTEKTVIFCHTTEKGKRYSLVPTAPGLCERSVTKFKGTPLHERLRSLWQQYRNDGMIVSLCGEPTPLMRTIPVESTLTNKTHILPYESVSKLIRNSGTIAVFDCACRVTEQRCNAPVETCFNFGAMAEFLIEKSVARRVTPDEALAILDRTEKAGLIHCGNNAADKATVICNCCSCCCLYLQGLVEFKKPHALATSSYLAFAIEDRCTGCGICYNGRCQVKAMTSRDSKAHVLTEKCIGCGLCASACPKGAIELRKRDVSPDVPASFMDLGLQVVKEKGKAEAFMEVMLK